MTPSQPSFSSYQPYLFLSFRLRTLLTRGFYCGCFVDYYFDFGFKATRSLFGFYGVGCLDGVGSSLSCFVVF